MPAKPAPATSASVVTGRRSCKRSSGFFVLSDRCEGALRQGGHHTFLRPCRTLPCALASQPPPVLPAFPRQSISLSRPPTSHSLHSIQPACSVLSFFGRLSRLILIHSNVRQKHRSDKMPDFVSMFFFHGKGDISRAET